MPSTANQFGDLRTDVLVVGGGLGGVAAALAASRRGANVVLTEDSDWLGGQLTTQAAPPDEHRWIEQRGAPASYRRLRAEIRALCRRWYPLTPSARRERFLNPGRGWVSRLCVEPWLAEVAIRGLLAPYVAQGRLTIIRNVRPIAADVDGDRVLGVTFARQDWTRFHAVAAFILDATEEGDVLPLANVERVLGFEAQRETGEPSAPREPQPTNIQSVTHAFALEHRVGQDHTIDRPRDYARWRAIKPSGWPGPLIGWAFSDPRSGRCVELPFTPNPSPLHAEVRAHGGDRPGERDLWLYRRVIARSQLEGDCASDVTIVNWPMNDYFVAHITGQDETTRIDRLQEARDLSLSLLYWLQTEAPRPDGGTGWPGLRLRGDVVGTLDGFAKRIYIRESRRIRAELTIAEQDVSRQVRGAYGALRYADTVGIGSYRIDLHPSTGGDSYIDVESCPFEIPLGALIPRRVTNLFASAKNIGTTHITNGCYRLHPVEWSIGEAAGTLAWFCLTNKHTARAVRADSALLENFQAALVEGGVELRWPESLR